MNTLYDTIGLNYSDLRLPDDRIKRQIHSALGDAQSILNVGAGTGSYEPVDRTVTAVEPSAEMIAQRTRPAANIVQGAAENLPFDDLTFDAAMASLTIHHWSDQEKGVAEMRRVTRGKIVFFTFDPTHQNFWLFDYFPELIDIDDKIMPLIDQYESWLGPVKISVVPVPHDCTDGFLAAYWRRPAAYLDERVRAAMSIFWKMGDISKALKRLETDLESGEWTRRYGHLNESNALDCGYRLVETL